MGMAVASCSLEEDFPMIPTVTLHDLVSVVSECADSEAEVVATVVHMVKSSRPVPAVCDPRRPILESPPSLRLEREGALDLLGSESSMNVSRERRNLYISGQAVELWEDPSRPFGWTESYLETYATSGEWELLFNALVLASLSDQQPS
jgi:hypothetical protein